MEKIYISSTFKDLNEQPKVAVTNQFLKTRIPSPTKPLFLKRFALGLFIAAAIYFLIAQALLSSQKDSKPSTTLKPAYVSEIEKKGATTKKNIQGYWEADIGGGIKMIYVPAGEFTMGSDENNDEKPIHKVYLDGYWIGKTEVTIGHYLKFANETKSHYPVWLEPGGEYNIETGSNNYYKEMGASLTGDNYPIFGISWHDAVAYCEWLSVKTGMKIVLPSEAQWEKAARGTDGRKYPWGNGKVSGELLNFADKQFFSKLPDYVWSDRAIDDGYIHTSPVGSFPSGTSPYGALDMSGNVWEWCFDWYDEYYKNSPQRNPLGPENGDDRVMRGGGWFDDSADCRCACRYSFGPVTCGNCVGFRLARSL